MSKVELLKNRILNTIEDGVEIFFGEEAEVAISVQETEEFPKICFLFNDGHAKGSACFIIQESGVKLINFGFCGNKSSNDRFMELSQRAHSIMSFAHHQEFSLAAGF